MIQKYWLYKSPNGPIRHNSIRIRPNDQKNQILISYLQVGSYGAANGIKYDQALPDHLVQENRSHSLFGSLFKGIGQRE